MNLEINTKEHSEQGSVIQLRGEIDVYTAPKLKEKLFPLVERNGHDVMIDLEEVEYMDSTGLGIFIGALKSSQKNEGTFKLRNVSPRIERLFKITGLTDVMDVKHKEDIG